MWIKKTPIGFDPQLSVGKLESKYQPFAYSHTHPPMVYCPCIPDAVGSIKDGDGMDNIRILLAEDREIVRKGIGGLIERIPNMDIVCKSADGGTAVRLARKFKPHVVILDVSMPERDITKNTGQMGIDFGFSLFEVVCRLLVNATKHANASGVKVTMYRNKNTTQAITEETFDEQSPKRLKAKIDDVSGFGIFNIRE